MLLYLEPAAAAFFDIFYGRFLQISKGLAINDDLYAVAGIDLVAVAYLVIQ